MWRFLASKILRMRITFLVIIGGLTLFMAYKASTIQLSYQFASALPQSDSAYLQYSEFKKMFGEDGSVMVIGFSDPQLFELEKFRDWYELGNRIKSIAGIKDVLSVANLYTMETNDSTESFTFSPLLKSSPTSQMQVDSIRKQVLNLPFYKGLIYNPESSATLMAITFTNKDLNTKHRIEIVKEIRKMGDDFSNKHRIEMHYSGMPYIRSAIMEKVSGEMTLFLALAVLVTALILGLFFRSFIVVFFSILVVAVGVIWSVGTIVLFGYKITILSGLIPPLIMVIGIPNCVFLINKYHNEYALHKNKVKALSRSIQTIGVTLFLANVTTAIGFIVLYFTNSSLLVEFGVVAALNVMLTFLITLILIPIIFSFLPAPTVKQMHYLEAKRITKALAWVDRLVHHRRKAIYIVITLLTLLGFVGMYSIQLNGYVVDDLPKEDPVYLDLKYFESNFKGVLPFEISVDTKKRNGIVSGGGTNLYKIQRLQKVMAQYPEFSRPLSVVEAIKFSYQAYRGGNPKYYLLPASSELQKLSGYFGSVKGKENQLKNFMDTGKQITRISLQMADVGSDRTKKLLNEIQPRIDSIFSPDKYNVNLTGHSLIFLKGNDYLLRNLVESLLIEILLIALVGIALFRSVRIILLSKLPCLIPLIITAGVMGFLGIRFKPSTILIFSIAFGISSDGTIYFLTKYRQELKKRTRSAGECISLAIRETGQSMIYTTVILFCGFSIFAASGFGGTVALGVLISITLLVSLATNIILLPAILLSIASRVSKNELLEKPFIEIDEEEEPA